MQQIDGQLRRDHARAAQHVPQGGSRDRGRRQEGFRLLAVVPKRHRMPLRIPAHPERRAHAVEERAGIHLFEAAAHLPFEGGAAHRAVAFGAGKGGKDRTDIFIVRIVGERRPEREGAAGRRAKTFRHQQATEDPAQAGSYKALQ